MCKRNLTRFRYRAAADQSRLRNSMMRRLERPLGDQTGLSRQARDGMYLGDLKSLVKLERRQDRRQPFGKHRLSRARRSDKKYVMSARRRDFQGTFRGLLSANLGK